MPVAAANRRSERDGMSLCVYALALLCVAISVSEAQKDKRSEMQPAPFRIGSRYGRSPQRSLSPRSDKFMMGSRYGKRSDRGSPPDLICEFSRRLALRACSVTHANAVNIRKRDDELISPDED